MNKCFLPTNAWCVLKNLCLVAFLQADTQPKSSNQLSNFGLSSIIQGKPGGVMKASSILVNYVLQFGTGPRVFKSRARKLTSCSAIKWRIRWLLLVVLMVINYSIYVYFYQNFSFILFFDKLSLLLRCFSFSWDALFNEYSHIEKKRLRHQFFSSVGAFPRRQAEIVFLWMSMDNVIVMHLDCKCCVSGSVCMVTILLLCELQIHTKV